MEFKLDPIIHSIPDQQLLDDLKSVADKLDEHHVTTEEYDEHGKHSSKTLRLRFNGWGEALEKAGLENLNPHNIPENDLLENIESVWLELGTQPRIEQMKRPLSKFSGKTYQKRFGSWNVALEKFIEYVNSDKVPETEDSPLQIEDVPFKHLTKRNPSNKLKYMILAKKGNKCNVCGIELIGTANMHFDHIKPWSKGGETTFENMQILCVQHNLEKGNLDLT